MDRRRTERRLRRAAETAATRQAPEPAATEAGRTVAPASPDTSPDTQVADDDPGQRLDQQTLWVDHQVRRAIARGDFDDLPGAGKPIPGIDAPHDPDWWVKKLVEREQITGVLPPALALRTEDAGLTDRLDRESAEREVRRLLEDFNARVTEARRQLLGGPPVITALRDVEAQVAAWQDRRDARRAAQRDARDAGPAQQDDRWWAGRAWARLRRR